MSAFVEQVREDRVVVERAHYFATRVSTKQSEEAFAVYFSAIVAATLRLAAEKVTLSDRVYTAIEAADFLDSLAEG